MHRFLFGVAVAVLLVAAPAGTASRPTAALPVLAAAANPPAPDPLTQPLKDGCQRNPGGLFSRTSPEWTYVYNTPSSSPAPPPQWVVGTVSSQNPVYAAVHTSGGDLPFGHAAYDYNVNVLADPPYAFLLGGDAVKKTGNYNGTGEESGRLHTEWEDLTVPQFAWAEPGDRLTELGSWVWDCGHWGPSTQLQNPDYVLPRVGQPCLGIVDPNACVITGERTEFHPYRAVWVERHQPVTSPTGEAEGDLFISTDRTPAGAEAECAHQFPPPAGVPDYGPDYRACLQTADNWQDVSGDYSFHLSAPPRPSPSAHMTYRLQPYLSDAGAPTLTPEGDGVRVTIHVNSPTGQRTRVGYAVYAGWDRLAPVDVPAHLRITFDKLEAHRAMDPGCTQNAFGLPVPGCTTSNQSTRNNQFGPAPGQWNLYVDVNGIWNRWTSAGGGELLINDGTVLTGGVPPVDLYVTRGSGWRLYVHGRECDLGGLSTASGLPPPLDCPSGVTDIADDNDVTGQILDRYPSAVAGVGTHRSNGQTRRQDPTSTCPDINPEGCYSLTYTVSLVDDSASRAIGAEPAAPLPATLRLPAAPLGGFALLALAAAGLGLRLIRRRPAGLR